MVRKIVALFGGTALLAACGSMSDLEPAQGSSLPDPAYGENTAPTAEQLLDPSTQARPARSGEILRRSERRENDEFDLPPPGDLHGTGAKD